jgi:hypothetical protein
MAPVLMGQSQPWSDRYLFSLFNDFQHHSTRFNTSELATLKRVEHYPQLPSERPLKGGRRAASGGSSMALSEA